MSQLRSPSRRWFAESRRRMFLAIALRLSTTVAKPDRPARAYRIGKGGATHE